MSTFTDIVNNNNNKHTAVVSQLVCEPLSKMDKASRRRLTTTEPSRGISPYCLPVVNNFVTPVPPATKRKERGSKVTTSGALRGRRLRPTTASSGADVSEVFGFLGNKTFLTKVLSCSPFRMITCNIELTTITNIRRCVDFCKTLRKSLYYMSLCVCLISLCVLILSKCKYRTL